MEIDCYKEPDFKIWNEKETSKWGKKEQNKEGKESKEWNTEARRWEKRGMLACNYLKLQFYYLLGTGKNLPTV